VAEEERAAWWESLHAKFVVISDALVDVCQKKFLSGAVHGVKYVVALCTACSEASKMKVSVPHWALNEPPLTAITVPLWMMAEIFSAAGFE